MTVIRRNYPLLSLSWSRCDAAKKCSIRVVFIWIVSKVFFMDRFTTEFTSKASTILSKTVFIVIADIEPLSIIDKLTIWGRFFASLECFFTLILTQILSKVLPMKRSTRFLTTETPLILPFKLPIITDIEPFWSIFIILLINLFTLWDIFGAGDLFAF